MTSEETPLYHRVKAHPTARIAPSAGIVGDVTIGRDASVFAGVQIRGDDAPVVIGDESNLQENTVVHVDFDVPCIVGPHCTVGHGTILHGCELGENVLVGMGSIVMNRAKIGANSLIGAGSLVTEGKSSRRAASSWHAGAREARADRRGDHVHVHLPRHDYVRQSGEMLEQGVLEHPAPTWTCTGSVGQAFSRSEEGLPKGSPSRFRS
ncbi:MAG: gamma carbonic anhydrase family protein [Adlercreutzia sp.]